MTQFYLPLQFQLKGDKCLELGIGTGVVSLCLLRVPDLCITGIDNDSEVLQLLKKNITLNGYDNDISIIKGDLNADNNFKN